MSSPYQIIVVLLLLAGIAAALYNSDLNPFKNGFNFGSKEEVQQPVNVGAPAPAPTSTTKPATQTTAPTPTQQGFTSNIQVAIKGFGYVSEEVRVKVGTKITWMNFDAAGHTVTSDANLFSSKLLSQGKSYEYIFTKPGTYPYHCAIHPSMKGKIIVEQ